ncbi:hypothetical protein glysoja_040120 [Glycine soja]|uniref:Uncharacterized protein n=1 Tax=Glycine soja TaxID=3848 RepID=A0A0B2PBA6_GLYSO|nr:hypothetical protein glysoja_040120 [Glycine soja]
MSLSFFSRGAPDPPSTAVPSSSSSRSEPSLRSCPLLRLSSSGVFEGLNSENNAEAEAATVTAPSRSKQHSDGDAEHEANAFQEVKKAKQKKSKKPKVTVAEAASRISADDLDAFLAEITVSVSFSQLICCLVQVWW